MKSEFLHKRGFWALLLVLGLCIGPVIGLSGMGMAESAFFIAIPLSILPGFLGIEFWLMKFFYGAHDINMVPIGIRITSISFYASLFVIVIGSLIFARKAPQRFLLIAFQISILLFIVTIVGCTQVELKGW